MLVERESSRIFGIGLSRTGTTSLGAALERLGIKTIHYPHDSATYKELASGEFHLSILEKYEAAVDISVAPFYAQLDEAYPDSRFILTTREIEPWLRSMETHWVWVQEWSRHNTQYARFTRFIWERLYGTFGFDEGKLRQAFAKHHDEVYDYFSARARTLLTLDVRRPDAWNALCSFLNLPTPDLPFPHSNSRKDPAKVKEWIGRRARTISGIAHLVKRNESLILVDDGRLAPIEGLGNRIFPFLEKDGEYSGPPPDDSTAIAELERLRGAGASYIAFAWPSFWWFDYYKSFASYLRDNTRVIESNDDIRALKLQP